jgi:SEL1 protein
MNKQLFLILLHQTAVMSRFAVFLLTMLAVVVADVEERCTAEGACTALDIAGTGTNDDPLDLNAEARQQARKDYLDGIMALYVDGNFTHALRMLKRSANHGEGRAMWLMGVFHAFGIGVAHSEAKAVLYHLFGALSGVPESHAALSYRYQHGFGVAPNCTKAVEHAKEAADAIAASNHDGLKIKIGHVRLSDHRHSSQTDAERDTMQINVFRAERGVTTSMMRLGYSYTYGMDGAAPDYQQALFYFNEALKAGEAAAYGALGQLYAYGIASASPPIPRDLERAIEYFTEGSKRRHPVSMNGLGALYALGVPGKMEQDFKKAAELFTAASSLGSAEAAYNLGVLLLNGKGVAQDVASATEHFVRAESVGHVLSSWQLAGIFRRRGNCQLALKHYQAVLAQGSWNRITAAAKSSFDQRKFGTALIDYLIASEVGVSVAKWNAAYILDKEHLFSGDGNDLWRLHRFLDDREIPQEEAQRQLVVALLQRAAFEGEIDAHLTLGDAYFYGNGVAKDSHRAAEHYARAAAHGGTSGAQASFNLGWMYEFGHVTDDTKPDFHLAKRHYDSAIEKQKDAMFAVTLALIRLNFHW